MGELAPAPAWLRASQAAFAAASADTAPGAAAPGAVPGASWPLARRGPLEYVDPVRTTGSGARGARGERTCWLMIAAAEPGTMRSIS